MATIQFLEKRISGCEAKIKSINDRLARIQKAEDSGWEDNPYYYDERQKRWALQDLDDAKKSLAKYKAQLAAEQEKAASRNVIPILEFLDLWKARCLEYYGSGLKAAFDALDEIRDMESRLDDATTKEQRTEIWDKVYALRRDYYRKCHGIYMDHAEVDRHGRKFVKSVKVEEGPWEYVQEYMEKDLEKSMAKLHAVIDQEADRKYDSIVERTQSIVGTITDASGLTVGAKQDLNGIIVGTRGTAKVSTIGAGGYAIQCFHFRTIINPVKK